MTLNLLSSHASVRKYQDVTLSTEQLHEIIQVAQHAASSNFVQAYSIIHVTDKDKRTQLAELSKNPQQILTAGAVIVLCMDFYRVEKGAALLGKEIDYSHAESLLVGVTDVGLFAQNIAIAAESKGYGICYIGGVRNAPEEISNLLNLPDGVAPLYAMSIGVPDEANEVKPRLPIEAIIHENGYDIDRYDDILPIYDKTMNDYYMKRGSNQKDAVWTDSMVAFLSEPRRTHMKDFLKKRGFEFK